jgi:hypothetical protein
VYFSGNNDPHDDNNELNDIASNLLFWVGWWFTL